MAHAMDLPCTPPPTHICSFTKKAPRPCCLYPGIEPRYKHFSCVASGSKPCRLLCFGIYPKRRGFRMLQGRFHHSIGHVRRANLDEDDVDAVVVVDDDGGGGGNETHHHVAHMNAFEILQSTHDDVAGANVTHDDDDDDVNIGAHHLGAHMSSLSNEIGSKESTRKLPHGLQTSLLPRHVAIIMDGNSRWATEKGMPSNAGHEAGVDALKLIVRLSAQWGVSALTVFGFSTENWHRPKVEVAFLMELFLKVLKAEYPSLTRENIAIHFIGNIKQLPGQLQSLIREVEHATSENSGLKLTIALNYSGRYDIAQACQKLAKKVKQGKLRPEDIGESDIEQELGTSWMKELRNPDLLIRTSGELRLSNFLLWQLAYTELYFMNERWPDVDEVRYADALLSYQKRDRRFGVRRPIDPNL